MGTGGREQADGGASKQMQARAGAGASSCEQAPPGPRPRPDGLESEPLTKAEIHRRPVVVPSRSRQKAYVSATHCEPVYTLWRWSNSSVSSGSFANDAGPERPMQQPCVNGNLACELLTTTKP